jgi:hypothetical protein
MSCVHLFFSCGFIELVAGVVFSSAARGVIRTKDKPITLLLTGACHRIPMRAYKLCRIPGVFVFACGIGLRGRTVMPSAGFLRGCIIPKSNAGDYDSPQSDNHSCFFL